MGVCCLEKKKKRWFSELQLLAHINRTAPRFIWKRTETTSLSLPNSVGVKTAQMKPSAPLFSTTCTPPCQFKAELHKFSCGLSGTEKRSSAFDVSLRNWNLKKVARVGLKSWWGIVWGPLLPSLRPPSSHLMKGEDVRTLLRHLLRLLH